MYNPWLLIVIFTRVYMYLLIAEPSVPLFSFDGVGLIKLSHLAFVDGVVFPEFEI